MNRIQRTSHAIGKIIGAIIIVLIVAAVIGGLTWTVQTIWTAILA